MLAAKERKERKGGRTPGSFALFAVFCGKRSPARRTRLSLVVLRITQKRPAVGAHGTERPSRKQRCWPRKNARSAKAEGNPDLCAFCVLLRQKKSAQKNKTFT